MSVFAARSGYVLCNIPSHGDVAAEIFGDDPPQSPQQSSKGSTATTTTATGTAGSGRRSSSTPPTAASPPAAGVSVADAAQPDDDAVEYFQPTHVVYLDASLEHIVSQQGLRGGGAEGGGGAAGKEAEAKLRADIERYFAEEEQQQLREDTQPDTKGNGEEEAGGDGNGDSSRREGERWIPATARALQERYAIKAAAIDAEGGGEDGGGVSVSRVVGAVNQHLCGGEIPAVVKMLSGGGAGSAEEQGESPADEKMERQEIAGGVPKRVSAYVGTMLGRRLNV